MKKLFVFLTITLSSTAWAQDPAFSTKRGGTTTSPATQNSQGLPHARPGYRLETPVPCKIETMRDSFATYPTYDHALRNDPGKTWTIIPIGSRANVLAVRPDPSRKDNRFYQLQITSGKEAGKTVWSDDKIMGFWKILDRQPLEVKW